MSSNEGGFLIQRQHGGEKMKSVTNKQVSFLGHSTHHREKVSFQMRSLIQPGAPDLYLLTRFHSWTLKRMLYFGHQEKKNKIPALSNFTCVSRKRSSLYIRLRTTFSLRGPWDSSLFCAVLDSFKINISIPCQKACPWCLGISVCTYRCLL